MKQFILATLFAVTAQAAILTTVDGDKKLDEVVVSVSGKTSKLTFSARRVIYMLIRIPEIKMRMILFHQGMLFMSE